MSYSEKLQESVEQLVSQKKISGEQGEYTKELYLRYKEYVDKRQEIDWKHVHPVSDAAMKNYDQLPEPSDAEIKDALGQIAVLKLNGGLGTSMGCEGPKSLLEVRGGDTFLDFTIKYIYYVNSKYGAHVPLVLMNSFNTEKQTKSHVSNVKDLEIIHFNQFELPRMDAGTNLPVNVSDSALFYPPGHGYVYECLKATGTLSKLIGRGIKYIFISNADNLGAVLDPKIAHFCITSGVDFCSEQTRKTLADVKGGILMEYDGRTRLLETAQVPKGHMDDFCDIKMFTTFNVNNLWVRTAALYELSKIYLDLIVNPKVAEGKSVIQLEVAAGAAISQFTNVTGLIIPRTRFAPVKKSSDLLILKSDCFTVQENFQLVQVAQPPLVTMDCKVDKFAGMFQHIPKIIGAKKIEIYGEVKVGKDVVIEGELIVPVGYTVVLEDGCRYVDGKKQ